MLPDNNSPPLDNDARRSLTTMLTAPSQRISLLPHDDACRSLTKMLDNNASLFLMTMLDNNASRSLTTMLADNASRSLRSTLDDYLPRWRQRHRRQQQLRGHRQQVQQRGGTAALAGSVAAGQCVICSTVASTH